MNSINKSLLSFILIFFSLTLSISAAPVQEKLVLDTAETNVQFIVEGENDIFEVELIMPSGEKYDQDTQKIDQNLYLPLINKRVWIIKSSPAGTYTLNITGDTSQSFKAYIQKALSMPTIQWHSPSDTTITVQENESLYLEWESTGDIREEIVRFQLSNSLFTFDIGEAHLKLNSFTLYVPHNVPNGTYKLLVTAETGPEEVEVSTNVNIVVDRDNSSLGFIVLDQGVENGHLYVDVQVKDDDWTFYGIVQNINSEPVLSTKEDTRNMIELMKNGQSYTYRWIVGGFDEGEYSAFIYGEYQDKYLSDIVTLKNFQVKKSNWNEDSIKWSIEDDITNARVLEFVLRGEEGTEIAVIEDDTVLLEGVLTKDNNQFGFPLTEGNHLYNVFIIDPNGNTYTFSKVLQVDHEAPRLEMIQPLQAHKKTLDGFTSGFVEQGTTLTINGKKIEYDENGYFKEKIGSAVIITLEDKVGNVTKYDWKQSNSSNKWIFTFVGINIGLIGITTAFIIILKRKNHT